MQNQETLKEFKAYIDKCIDMLWLMWEVKWEKEDIQRLSIFLRIESFTNKREVNTYLVSLAELIEKSKILEKPNKIESSREIT